LKIHLHRLEEMEYLLVHRGGRGQSFVYELLFAHQADSGRPTLPGLIEIESLGKHLYDEKKSGLEAGKSGSSRSQVGGMSGAVKTLSPPMPMRVPENTEYEVEESTYTGAHRNGHYVLTMAGRK
jgi:DNA primase